MFNKLSCLSKYYFYNRESVEKFYIGSTKNSFKTRWHQHILSFTNSTYKNSTSLSKYFWDLKEAK